VTGVVPGVTGATLPVGATAGAFPVSGAGALEGVADGVSDTPVVNQCSSSFAIEIFVKPSHAKRRRRLILQMTAHQIRLGRRSFDKLPVGNWTACTLSSS